MRKRIEWPAYLPDIPPVGNMLTVAENVYPTANGYSPVGSFVAQTDALPYAFSGGASFIATDGTTYLLAGTDGGIYKLTGSAWTSLTASGAGRWHFVQFKNYAIAVNGGTTKVINLLAGTGGDLAGSPTGTSIAVIGPFVVIGQAGGDKLKVQWSAFDDHTSWTPAVNQSGFQGMNDGGEVMGLASGEYGLILQRFAITRMSRTGDSLQPFDFQQVTNNFGCASKASIVQAGRTVFCLSDRGFIAVEDGQTVRPIGNEQVDATFRSLVAQADYERIHTAVDPKRSMVFWGVPGTPGVIFCYNWALQRWATIRLPFSGFFSGYQAGMTIEQVSALYPNIDMMPYSLDDTRFQGGDPRLYFVGTDKTVGALTGPTLASTIKTAWQEPFAGKRARIRSVWPITDATAGVTVTVDARHRMGDGMLPVASASMQVSGRVPIRATGRYQQVMVQHEAGSAWSYDQGFDMDCEAAGER